MKTRISPRFLGALGLLVAPSACQRGASPAPTVPAAEPSRAQETGHEEEHGHGKPSDLDRPVDALVAERCEHERPAFACDTCRYEVGFVRVPVSLVESGLLELAKVERRQVRVPVHLTGEVRFDERRVAHVRSQVEGIVKRVHVALGDRVRRGQPLVELDSVVVGEAQATNLETTALVELGRRNFERIAQLRRENIASEREYLQAKQELEAAEIRAAAARGKLGRLGSGSGRGGRLLLRAPMDGRVLVLHAVSGELARPDEALLTVGDNARVWVWADLYERDLAAVTQGQAAHKLTASVAVKAYPGEEFPGAVDLISPAMDESSRTVKVRVEVANPEGRLLAGMFATVKVFLPGADQVLAVPRAAMLEDEGRSFVFVHHGGDDYVRRPVTPGRSWAGWVEVQAGLAAGQTIAADGAFLLKSDVLRSKMGAGCAD